MLLNATDSSSAPPPPPPASPSSLAKTPVRYDPVHHPDLPSPVEMASFSTTGYFSSPFAHRGGEEPSHAASGLAALNARPLHQGTLLGVQASRATTSSPTISTGPLSSVSLSPRASPSRPQSRPTTTSSSSRSMPPPPPVCLPYNPRQRISPPKSVLVPITAEEVHRLAETHRNPLRKTVPTVAGQLDNLDRLFGSSPDLSHVQIDPSGRAWSPSGPNEGPGTTTTESSNISPERGTKRPADSSDDGVDYGRMLHPAHRQNDQLVAKHYNARPEVGKQQREHSPIIGLKSFNNWIKAVMIAKFARPAIRETNSRPEGMEFVGSKRRPKYTARVLDLGCGKGGDLGKWAKAEIANYVGVDIADVSIDQARERWAGQRRKAFDAEFFALDCYSVRILLFNLLCYFFFLLVFFHLYRIHWTHYFHRGHCDSLTLCRCNSACTTRSNQKIKFE